MAQSYQAILLFPLSLFAIAHRQLPRFTVEPFGALYNSNIATAGRQWRPLLRIL